jgi:hypothetical protein
MLKAVSRHCVNRTRAATKHYYANSKKRRNDWPKQIELQQLTRSSQET